MIRCPKCAFENPESDKVCRVCGTKVEELLKLKSVKVTDADVRDMVGMLVIDSCGKILGEFIGIVHREGKICLNIIKHNYTTRKTDTVDLEKLTETLATMFVSSKRLVSKKLKEKDVKELYRIAAEDLNINPKDVGKDEIIKFATKRGVKIPTKTVTETLDVPTTTYIPWDRIISFGKTKKDHCIYVESDKTPVKTKFQDIAELKDKMVINTKADILGCVESFAMGMDGPGVIICADIESQIMDLEDLKKVLMRSDGVKDINRLLMNVRKTLSIKPGKKIEDYTLVEYAKKKKIEIPYKSYTKKETVETKSWSEILASDDVVIVK